MKVTSTISVNLRHPNAGARVDAVQNDLNTRAVQIRLFDGDEMWTVPSGVTASIGYRKPDRTKGVYDKLPDGTAAVEINGSMATIILTQQVLTVPGQVNACLVFNDAALNQLTSFPFIIRVEANPSSNAVRSEDYIRLEWLEEELDKYVQIATGGAVAAANAANAAAQTANTAANNADAAERLRAEAENQRASAETERKESEATRSNAEALRVAAENGRVSAENDRATAENTRNEAEAARANAEDARASAETSRAGVENARETAEASRADAENSRVVAEQSRDSAEDERSTAEANREAAENSRASAETQRQTNSAKAVQDAEKATEDCVAAAASANEAANNANAAAASTLDLENRLKSGLIDDAGLHLGFYIDADGDLCQKED